MIIDKSKMEVRAKVELSERGGTRGSLFVSHFISSFISFLHSIYIHFPLVSSFYFSVR